MPGVHDGLPVGVFGIDELGPGDLFVGDIGLEIFEVGFVGDAEDFEAEGIEFGEFLFEHFHLLSAAGVSGGPDVHEDDFAFPFFAGEGCGLLKGGNECDAGDEEGSSDAGDGFVAEGGFAFHIFVDDVFDLGGEFFGGGADPHHFEEAGSEELVFGGLFGEGFDGGDDFGLGAGVGAADPPVAHGGGHFGVERLGGAGVFNEAVEAFVHIFIAEGGHHGHIAEDFELLGGAGGGIGAAEFFDEEVLFFEEWDGDGADGGAGVLFGEGGFGAGVVEFDIQVLELQGEDVGGAGGAVGCRRGGFGEGESGGEGRGEEEGGAAEPGRDIVG